MQLVAIGEGKSRDKQCRRRNFFPLSLPRWKSMTKISTAFVFTFRVSVSQQMLPGIASLSGNCWKRAVAGITVGMGNEEGRGGNSTH